MIADADNVDDDQWTLFTIVFDCDMFGKFVNLNIYMSLASKPVCIATKSSFIVSSHYTYYIFMFRMIIELVNNDNDGA